jgi:hypothetical protein
MIDSHQHGLSDLQRYFFFLPRSLCSQYSVSLKMRSSNSRKLVVYDSVSPFPQVPAPFLFLF